MLFWSLRIRLLFIRALPVLGSRWLVPVGVAPSMRFEFWFGLGFERVAFLKASGPAGLAGTRCGATIETEMSARLAAFPTSSWQPLQY